jgi:hypothetical protein
LFQSWRSFSSNINTSSKPDVEAKVAADEKQEGAHEITQEVKQEIKEIKPTLAERYVSYAPGVAASAAVMTGGFFLADKIGKAMMAWQGLPTDGASPLSGIPVAIILGLALNNAVSLPASLQPGLKFCTTTVLRAGIVCVGIKLSMFDVMKLGVGGLPVVVASVSSGLVFVTWFNRQLGLAPRLGLLTAAGTSICGVTAIVSLAPAIKATEQEVCHAYIPHKHPWTFPNTCNPPTPRSHAHTLS